MHELIALDAMRVLWHVTKQNRLCSEAICFMVLVLFLWSFVHAFFSSAAVQLLAAIPDEEFSMDAHHTVPLLSSMSQAVALAPRLKVKWVRTDCLTSLDLRGVVLTDPCWSNLVMSFTAIPGLRDLHVQLPRYESALSQTLPSQPLAMDGDRVNLSRPSPGVVVPGIWCEGCANAYRPAFYSRGERPRVGAIAWLGPAYCCACGYGLQLLDREH